MMTAARRLSIGAGAATLAAAWFGPLPGMSVHAFSAHMAMHMAVVAIAAPLLAWGASGTRVDPVLAAPRLFAPIPASLVELMAVWIWHAPALHQAARLHGAVFALEQASFLGAGLLLWLSALGGTSAAQTWRAAAGIGALVFTSMHMTLLGALFALTPRPLYPHGAPDAGQLEDEHLGGAIMLLAGGVSYLAGGLLLTLQVTARHVAPAGVPAPGGPEPSVGRGRGEIREDAAKGRV